MTKYLGKSYQTKQMNLSDSKSKIYQQTGHKGPRGVKDRSALWAKLLSELYQNLIQGSLECQLNSSFYRIEIYLIGRP